MQIINVKPNGILEFAGKEYRCALGRGGVGADKREGDGKTPAGEFAIRKVMYRPDRMTEIKTSLPIEAIEKDDGWCDDPGDLNYNKQVKLPYGGHHEKLWRDDEIYDILVVLGYNDNPPEAGKGSAIFMHVARPGYTPTDGCIALSKPNLAEILAALQPDGRILIK